MWTTFGSVQFPPQFGDKIQGSSVPSLLPSDFPSSLESSPWIMEEALWEIFGVYLLPLQNLVISLLNTMLLGMIESFTPYCWEGAVIYQGVHIHCRGMEWTEGDRGLYISVMNSFISGHKSQHFYLKQAHHDSPGFIFTFPLSTLKLSFCFFFSF